MRVYKYIQQDTSERGNRKGIPDLILNGSFKYSKLLSLNDIHEGSVVYPGNRPANKLLSGHYIWVYCASLRSDNILMWSYYSSDHSGYVVEYEVDQNSKPYADDSTLRKSISGPIEIRPLPNDHGGFIHHVRYSHHIPMTSEDRVSSEGQIRDASTYKSVQWSHEEEVRWVLYGDIFGGSLERMNRDMATYTDQLEGKMENISVKSITVGYRCSCTQFLEIVNSLRKFSNDTIELRLSLPDGYTYSMKSVILDVGTIQTNKYDLQAAVEDTNGGRYLFTENHDVTNSVHLYSELSAAAKKMIQDDFKTYKQC